MFWKYDGPSERVYVDVPVTVSPGDVVERDEAPAEDGWWTRVDSAEGGRLVRPDNAADEEPASPEPDAMISTPETTEE